MKKNRLLIRLAIVGGILLAFYLVARLSGGFRVYKTPTMGNSPGIQPNDYIYVSNWISYERFDFVCYSAVDPNFGEGTFTHRLCGLPGDTIEIKNGDLFVNGRNADKTLNVKHNYIVPIRSSRGLHKIEGVDFLGRSGSYPDSIHVAMESRLVESYMGAQQLLDNEPFKVNKQFPQEWSLDNFGPLILEEGELFMLGDNRNGSIDSRQYGLAKESDITGVVMNKD